MKGVNMSFTIFWGLLATFVKLKGYVNPFINHKGYCKSGANIIFTKFSLTKYLYYMSVPMPYAQGQWEDYNKFLSLYSV